MTGIDLVHVPYKGAGPALTDLLAGKSSWCAPARWRRCRMCARPLRALAMTSLTRSRAAPDIPTVAESGVPGYESTLWYALLAPAGTPKPIVRRLHAETARVVHSPDVAEKLLGLGADPIGGSPEDLSKFLKTEIDRWTQVIREAHIVAN